MTIQATNLALGEARDAVYDKMKELLAPESTLEGGAKTTALLDAQSTLGITDGVQNILSKGYNRWQQTGQ